MKKIFLFTLVFMLLLSGCSNISTNSNNIQNLSVEVFEDIIEKNNINCNDYIEYNGNLAVALSDKIVVKFGLECKEIAFDNPNSLAADNNFLYFLNESNNEIYSVDYNSFDVKSIYSTQDVITYYWAIGNGNLFIETSTKTSDNLLETTSEFILNPQTNNCYAKEDSVAYQGVSCVAVDMQNEIGESVTRLFYDDSYHDFDYISNPCRIGDFIYYIKNPEIINESKQIFTVYSYSVAEEKESAFAEYEANSNDGVWDVVIKDIFAYNDNIYLEIGINQSNSAEYEGLEFHQFNTNGELIKKHKINKVIDSTTINFFNNRMYYNDLDGELNVIDLTA